MMEKKKRLSLKTFSNKHDNLIPRENVLREFMTGHSVVSVCGKICKTSCINQTWIIKIRKNEHR